MTWVFVIILALHILSAYYLPCLLILYKCSGPHSVSDLQPYINNSYTALYPINRLELTARSIITNNKIMTFSKKGQILCIRIQECSISPHPTKHNKIPYPTTHNLITHSGSNSSLSCYLLVLSFAAPPAPLINFRG